MALVSSVGYGVAIAGKILNIKAGARVLVLENDHTSPVLEWMARAPQQGFTVEAVPQPGGDAAAKETPRMAFAYLHAALGDGAIALCRDWFPEHAGQFPVLAQMIARGVNCPRTTSMGRLFDAAAALLGICQYLSLIHISEPTRPY